MTNPSEEYIQARIAEELGPEPDWTSMEPDQVDGEKLWRRLGEINVRLSYNEEAAEAYKDITEEFLRERVPLEVTQADLKRTVKDQAGLEQIFSRFLEVDLENGDEQDRIRARKTLCDIWSRCETLKWTGEPNKPSFTEGLFFLRLRREIPESAEQVYSIHDPVTGVWNMERDEAYDMLEEITEDQPELLKRVRKLRERWDPEDLYATGSTYDYD